MLGGGFKTKKKPRLIQTITKKRLGRRVRMVGLGKKKKKKKKKKKNKTQENKNKGRDQQTDA